jgi:ParB/RepB/Spo0J family partition protein
MKSSEIWNELGNTCFKAGRLDKAAAAYGKAIEKESQSGWSYSNLAAIYVQQGKYSDALPLYQKSLEMFTHYKEQATTWERIGSVYRLLNEYGKAIQAYQKAEKIVHLRAPKAISPFSQNKSWHDYDVDIPTGKVLQSASQDRKTEPVPATRGDEREEYSETTGEQVHSETDFSKFKNGIEENANVWNELGLVLFKVGAYDDAIDAYRKAIELEPTYGYLYSNLGQVYVAQGRLAEAIDLYEKSIKLLPNDKDRAISWIRLGDIFRQLGQFDEALAACQLADALNQGQAAPVSEFRQLNLDFIVASPGQTRELDDLDDLVISIRVHGIIQPLIVCPGRDRSGKYSLIAGRRRLEAARRAGLKEVPVIVRQANEQEILELSINENIHNAAINPFELANGYRQMANEFDLSMEEISARVGRSCHSVANTMKVLELPDDAREVLHYKDQISDQDDVIMRSLAETQSLDFGLQSISAFEPVADQHEPAEIQINTVKTGSSSKLENSPKLWYLETETDNAAKRQDDDTPETNSLLMRARHVLQCNPHAKRIWSTPVYQV